MRIATCCVPKNNGARGCGGGLRSAAFLTALVSCSIRSSGLTRPASSRVSSDLSCAVECTVIATGAPDAEARLRRAVSSASRAPCVCISPGRIVIDRPLRIRHSVSVRGIQAEIVAAFEGGPLVSVEASQVSLDGLSLRGPAPAPFAQHAIAVRAVGTAAQPLRGFSMTDCTVRSFANAGVWLEHVEGFSLRGLRISNVGYAGILANSCGQGAIVGNVIRDVRGVPGFNRNGYGVALTRAEEPDLARAGRSHDIDVISNLVDGVPTWTAYDTHGGERIAFIGNSASHCRMALGIGASDDVAGPRWAPHDVVAAGNDFDSGMRNGDASYGIVFHGAYRGPGGLATGVVLDYATGVILGNSLRGFGDSAYPSMGAIYAYATRGLVIVGNDVSEWSTAAVALDFHNDAAVVCGNRVSRPVRGAGARAPAAMTLLAGHNSAVAFANSFSSRIANDASGAGQPTLGVWLSAANATSRNQLSMRDNRIVADVPLRDEALTPGVPLADLALSAFDVGPLSRWCGRR